MNRAIMFKKSLSNPCLRTLAMGVAAAAMSLGIGTSARADRGWWRCSARGFMEVCHPGVDGRGSGKDNSSHGE